jgi:antitoxin CptB
MSGTTRSSAGLDLRRRRALYRAWHRGTREMDLIMGRFADAEISSMAEDELEAFERLIEVPDPDLYGWISGDDETPVDHRSAVFDRLRTFHSRGQPTRA